MKKTASRRGVRVCSKDIMNSSNIWFYFLKIKVYDFNWDFSKVWSSLFLQSGTKSLPKIEPFCNNYQNLISWIEVSCKIRLFLVHSAEMPRFHSGCLSRDPGSIFRETGMPKIPNFPGIPVPGIPGRKLYYWVNLKQGSKFIIESYMLAGKIVGFME